jgi:hypothetical protein
VLNLKIEQENNVLLKENKDLKQKNHEMKELSE